MIQKLRKSKGFTLIEMLVVIAIIAVLVSIIIPVVGNSTVKAKAATDAANLRSAQSTLTIALLNSSDLSSITAKANGDKESYKTLVKAAAPECKSDKSWEFRYEIDSTGNVTTYFYGEGKIHNLAYFSEIAESGSATTTPSETTLPSPDPIPENE